MSNFIERQIDVIVDLVDSAKQTGLDEYYIPITRPFNDDANDEAPVAKYIKKDREEYYRIASNQWSVRPIDTDLMDILTPEGIAFYKEAEEKHHNGNHKDILSPYAFEKTKSGFWSPDKKSPYYVPNTNGEHWSCLNSWRNIVISGYSEKSKEWITTSPAIFVTDNWCLTYSGSLYQLGEKIDIVDAYTLMQKQVQEPEPDPDPENTESEN